MASYSKLLSHLESGHCSKLRDPTLLLRCLGQWWYSVLYMDIDIHAQIRTGRVTLSELLQWVNAGQLKPFVCREENCGKTFAQLSELTRHWEEDEECEWAIARLNIQGLEKELGLVYLRRDSGVA